jgi:hypothetical protein
MFQTTNQNISHELLVANYLPAGLPSQSASPSSNIPVESFIGLELAEAIRNRTRHRRLFHGFLPVFSRTSPCFPCFLYLVGGIPTLWKIWVRQWEGWHPIYYPIYEMENKIHVSNNQPAMFSPYVFSINVFPVRFRHPKKSPKSLNVQWFQRPLRLPSHPEPEMFPITGFQERLGFSRTKSLVLSEVPINHGHVWRKNNNYSYI